MKIFRKLKQILLLLLLSLQSFGALYAQKDSFTLNMREASIKDVIKAISAQSNFSFVYSDADVAKVEKKNISFTNESIIKILDYCLSSSQLEYEIKDNIIIIKKSNPKKQDDQPQKPITQLLKGVVTDIAGRPMEGVAVMVKGTTTGIATDNKGYYEIKVPRQATIVYAMLGMKRREIIYRGQNEQNIIMEEEAAEVGEVVVTGVFTKAKESYTGSVSTVTSREIQAFRGQNLVQTLKNIDPTINISVDNNLGSNPNVIPQITVRGNSSLPMSVEEYNAGLKTNVNTPLIIMDGFQISLTKLMDYNDEDIESINILKDASATAIYGSRGANGVIVVISKAPQSGRLRINAQAGLSLEMPDLTTYDLLNASELLNLQNRLGIYTYAPSHSANEYRQKSYELRLKDVLEGVNTDWLHYPVRTGASRKYNIRMEGGSNEFRWGVTASSNITEGAMKGSSRDNFNAGMTLSYTYRNVIFKNQFRLGVNKSTESPYGTFSTYANMMPYYKPYNEDGSLIKDFMGLYTVNSRIQNPLYDAILDTKNESRYTELINNFSIEWNILPELKLRAQMGISKKINQTDRYLPAEHSTFKTSVYETEEGYFRKGKYTYGTGSNTSYDADAVLSYTKTFKGKHQLYAGLNYSIQSGDNYMYNFIVEGFSSSSKPFLGNALQYDATGMPNGTESSSRRVGLTGNINYTLSNRYYADFSYRIDGSSQFGSKSKYAPFWSMGLGWNLHRENFLKNSNYINNLRFKASYGQTGSQQFSPYQALQTYQYYTDNRYLNRTGAYLMALGNENLKWQLTDQFNTGLEIGVLNNRLSASFDYYIKQTSDLLSSRDLPLSTGYSSYIDNIGEVKNYGYEASLNGYIFRDTEKGFVWMLGVKLAYNKNEISKLSDAIKAQTEKYKAQNVDMGTLFYEGYSQNSLWAVKSLGIDPSTGKELYLDKNGNITEVWEPSAKIYCGISEPLYRGNLNSMLRYKSFSLNLSFGYHWGGQVYNQTLVDKVEVTINTVGARNVDRRVFTERWTKPGDLTFYKGFSNTATRATSRFVMDDNVFELQSASLQYRLDKETFKKKYKIQSVLLEMNMSDIFYISSVKRERGISYPFARRAGFSVSLMF